MEESQNTKTFKHSKNLKIFAEYKNTKNVYELRQHGLFVYGYKNGELIGILSIRDIVLLMDKEEVLNG